MNYPNRRRSLRKKPGQKVLLNAKAQTAVNNPKHGGNAMIVEGAAPV